MRTLTSKQLLFNGAVLGTAYGVFARFVFGLGVLEEFFQVMSVAFIFGVPLVLGFITVLLGEKETQNKWFLWITMPWLSSLACLLCAMALAWEGLICIIILLPLILFLSSIGGLIAGICLKNIKSKHDRNYCMVIVALIPFIASPIEQLKSARSEIRTAQTKIKIHASPQTIWNQIRSVPLITEKEQSWSFSKMIGFPQPLEAKLVGEGVGAVRYATFKKGVLFVETITQWDEPNRLSFSIHADTKTIPSTTFDEHVIIGGKYFDVLNGTYSIEDIGNGDVLLHLSSEQRLSTRVNFYSHFWTEYLMSDLQNYILRIIKKRCENQV